jgi:hypothetical protein
MTAPDLNADSGAVSKLISPFPPTKRQVFPGRVLKIEVDPWRLIPLKPAIALVSTVRVP